MFTVIAYSADLGAGGTGVDLPAVVDTQFPVRNNHFVFTEPYNLIHTVTALVNTNQARYNVPTWNVIGPNGILTGASTLLITTNSPVDPRWEYPTKIPLNEEVAIQVDTLAASGGFRSYALLWIATPNHSRRLPQGIHRLQMFFDLGNLTPTVGVWNTPIAIPLPPSLRGGVYAVIGCSVANAEAAAARLIFPEGPTYQGRKLRPGIIPMTASTGDLSRLQPYWQNYFGEWGRFHTFNPPEIEFLGEVAAAFLVQGWLDLVYLGTDKSLLMQGPQP